MKNFCWKFICSLLFFVCYCSTNSYGHTNSILSRNARSPQLFGSRGNNNSPFGNLVGDNLKPVTLNDIVSLREKIANLTNLSDYFRKAIEEGTKARSYLQDNLVKAKEKVKELQNAVNPDLENYFVMSKNCGGIMIGQTGKIVYKENEYCSNNERCVWTIQANQRSKVKLTLTKSSLKTDSEFIAVSEISLDVANQRTVTKRITSEDEIYLFDGPVIIVTLYTDAIGESSGFSLDFEGFGNNIQPEVKFEHVHFKDYYITDSENSSDEGQSKMDFEKDSSKVLKEITTYVVNPKLTNFSTLDVHVGDVMLNNSGNCENVSLNFYPSLLNPYSYPEKCCSNGCTNVYFALDAIFFAILVQNTPQNASMDFSWSFDNTSNTIESTTCGGVLNITSVGVIDYKHNTYYGNNERCVWRVQSAYKSQLKLKIIKEGFEKGYDFVTVTEFGYDISNAPNIYTLPAENSFRIVSGPLTLITFYSDNSQIGTGFILQLEAVGISRKALDFENGDHFFHITEPEGTRVFNTDSTSLAQGWKPNFMTFIIVINPVFSDGSSLEMTVKNLNVEKEKVENDDDLTVSIYDSNKGNYSIVERVILPNVSEISEKTFTSIDGIILLEYHVLADSGKDFELSWNKGNITTSVATGEGEIHVEQVEGCGGLLIGDSGKINYKLNETYSFNERCTWAIKSKKRSKITLNLVKDGFEYCCDYLIVTELNEETGKLRNATTHIRRGDPSRSFGPTIFLTFLSDKTEMGTGFSITFVTGGTELTDELEFNYQSFLEPNGQYTYSKNSPAEDSTTESVLVAPRKQISTYVISPREETETEKTHLTMDSLDIGNPNDCNDISFAIYTYDLYKSEEFFLKETSEHDGCNFNNETAGIGNEIKAVDGWFLIIFKSDLPVTTNFEFHWNQNKPKIFPFLIPI